MTAIFLTPVFPTLIQPNQFGRNGQVASAWLESRLRADTNLLMYYRTKEYFQTPGYYIPPAGAAGTRERFRFFAHSGPNARRVNVHVLMAIDDNGLGHANTDPYATFALYDSSLVQIGSSLEFHYGASSSSASNVPDEWAHLSSTIDIDPDIDFYGVFSEVDYARIIAAMAYEDALQPDTDNGYFLGVTSGANIYDSHREDLVTGLHAIWKHGKASFVTWAFDAGSRQTTSATSTNIVDNSSTAVSASTPGFYWDPTGKARLTGTTVPCVLAAWGKYTAGGAGKHGTVTLKDSGGTTIGSISNGWNNGAAALATATIDMPTTAGKIDIQFSTDSGTFDLYGVYVYEYKT